MVGGERGKQPPILGPPPEIAQCELSGGIRPGVLHSSSHTHGEPTARSKKAMIFTLACCLSLVQPPLESHSVSSQGVPAKRLSSPRLIPMVNQQQKEKHVKKGQQPKKGQTLTTTPCILHSPCNSNILTILSPFSMQFPTFCPRILHSPCKQQTEQKQTKNKEKNRSRLRSLHSPFLIPYPWFHDISCSFITCG